MQPQWSTAGRRRCPNCGRELAQMLGGRCPACMVRIVRQTTCGVTEGVSAKEETSSEKQIGPDAPRYFGDYHLLSELGRGGMGIVYRARQLSLNRVVALKLIAPEQLSSPTAVERFEMEAKAAANLDHPNVVPVHDTGVFEGRHYFSMRLVEGESLAAKMGDFWLPLAKSTSRSKSALKAQATGRAMRIASVVATVADAVHYAHQRGVLHRDLKPGNILIDAAGQPYVTDFGLAKRVEADNSLTLAGEVLGTPAYMAPEQAAGKTSQTTTAVDIYSLGAILYELLTGRPPFQAGTSMELLHALLHDEPSVPRQLNPAVPRDLETICLKCLEKDPARRYTSARAFAEDLRHFIQGEPVQARAISAPDKLWRWCCRKPALAGTLLILQVVLALGVAGILWQWRDARSNAAESRRIAYGSEIALAQEALRLNNFGRVRNLLERQTPQPGQQDLRGFEWRYLWQISRGDELFTFRGHSNCVAAVAVSPDGSLLATAALNETIRIWNLKTRKLIRVLERTAGTVKSLAFSPDGTNLATRGAQEVTLWDVKTWSPVRVLAAPSDFSFNASGWVEFSANGRWIATRLSQDKVQLWSTADWEPTISLSLPDQAPRRILSAITALSGDGQFLAMVRGGGKVYLWNVPQHLQIALLPFGPDIHSLTFSADGKFLAAGASDGRVKLWDVDTTRAIAEWDAHANWVMGLAFSPDGHLLATGGGDQLIHLWQVPQDATWEQSTNPPAQIATLRGHEDQVWALTFVQAGQFIVSGSQDGTAKLWRTAPSLSQRGFTNQFAWFRLSRDGQTITGEDPTEGIKTWDLTSGEPLNTFAMPPAPDGVYCDQLSPDAHMLAQGTTNGTILIWALPSREALGSMVGQPPGISRLVFSAHNRRLLAFSEGKLATVWDLRSRYEVDQFTALESGCSISPDGRYVAASNGDSRKIRLRDVTARRDIAILGDFKRESYVSEFSPDGRLLAVGANDNAIRLWQVPSGHLVRVLQGHITGIEGLAFSPDARTLVTAASFDSVKFWQVATGQEVLSFRETSRYPSQIGFSADGTTMVLLDRPEQGNGVLLFWRAPSWEQIAAEQKGMR